MRKTCIFALSAFTIIVLFVVVNGTDVLFKVNNSLN